MRMHSPSLSELHAFAAAARLGSYSLAAQELYVTQGGISRAIARLEEHLGFALFERLGRRNALTAAGQDYLQAIEPAVMAIEAASAAARRRRHGPQLRLSVIPTLFSHWLIPRLPDFNRRYPQIMLSFAPYRRDDPLNAPEIDAWIRVGSQHWPAGVEADARAAGAEPHPQRAGFAEPPAAVPHQLPGQLGQLDAGPGPEPALPRPGRGL